jgi:outer membrane protein assembly factor BamA
VTVLVRALIPVVVVCLVAHAAHAQETRSGLIEAQQAEKAAAATPPPPSKAEQVTEWIQDRLLTERPRSFFPIIDSVYGGGGFTLGAGYRQAFGDNAQWAVRGLYSIKQYKLIEFSALSTNRPTRRPVFGVTLGWRDMTRVGFYGLGMDSTRGDRADFRYQQTYARASAQWHAMRWLRAGAMVSYENFDEGEPTGDRPAVDEVYTPSTAPGLGASPHFLRTDLRVGFDTRTSPFYSRVGTYLGGALLNYIDPDHTYSFNRVDIEGVQHLPILRETWVLSLRARVQSTVDDDDLVPYFLLPSLGGGSSLRGYSSWRFRDRHSILASVEWRWIPNRLGMDMAVFFDAGKVTSRRRDLNFSGLEHDAGVGLRFHTPTMMVLRTELAHGSEGWKAVFASGAAF